MRHSASNNADMTMALLCSWLPGSLNAIQFEKIKRMSRRNSLGERSKWLLILLFTVSRSIGERVRLW